MKRIVLAGAGHAHIVALRRFAKTRPAAEIIIVNAGCFAWYTGALPALIRGDIAEEQARLDVQVLAQNCGAQFIDVRYAGFENDIVLLQHHHPIAFDVLSLSLGGAEIPGGVKPIPDFIARLKLWDKMVAPKLGLIGAGAGGVELALALRIRLGPKAQITLGGAEILPGAPHAAQRIAAKALHAANITITGTLPEGLDATIRAYTPEPPLIIRPTLQLPGHDNIFAGGDCARFLHPLPRSGAIAVRQGRVLAHNLTHRRLKIFKPPQSTLAIISLNANAALAWYGRFSCSGTLPMRLKTWLDKKWLR